MVDLQVVLMVCNRKLEDREPLDSVALFMDGFKVESMIYTCSAGNQEQDEEDELVHELPDDGYEEDEIDVEVEECHDGRDIASAFARFVYENFTDNTMIIAYDMNDEMFNEVKYRLEEISNNYQLISFTDIFPFMKNNNITIKQLLGQYNIRENMLLPDSEISLAYFLGVLINQVYDK